MTSNELAAALPCPFCGCTDISVHVGSTFRWRYASCDECGAQAGEVRAQTLGDGPKEEWESAAHADAIAEWNRRATLPDDGGLQGQVVVQRSMLEHLTHEVERLRAELDGVRGTLTDERYCHAQTIAQLKQASSEVVKAQADRATRAEAKLAECEADARRYRWIRDADEGTPLLREIPHLAESELDAAIDAAMKEDK